MAEDKSKFDWFKSEINSFIDQINSQLNEGSESEMSLSSTDN